jgi:hypothetical protein
MQYKCGVLHRTLSDCGTVADGSAPEIPNYVILQKSTTVSQGCYDSRHIEHGQAAKVVKFIWFISDRSEKNCMQNKSNGWCSIFDWNRLDWTPFNKCANRTTTIFFLSFHPPFSNYKNIALQNIPPSKFCMHSLSPQSTRQGEKEWSSRLIVGRGRKNPSTHYTISIFTVDVNVDPEDGGWRFFRNVGKYRPDYTVSRPTRL